ncbi:hypothetical protein L596_028468 [Steinernema carpocapsae]|uniref:Uncharacterized protein n=1 Tax=Steinernema carpocapsae TaxID=34508 RepID=A0A4U5LYK8_STECR|nr:hypothetical protein L596_028468 [Steinernema carpocapsae]
MVRVVVVLVGAFVALFPRFHATTSIGAVGKHFVCFAQFGVACPFGKEAISKCCSDNDSCLRSKKSIGSCNDAFCACVTKVSMSSWFCSDILIDASCSKDYSRSMFHLASDLKFWIFAWKELVGGFLVASLASFLICSLLLK